MVIHRFRLLSFIETRVEIFSFDVQAHCTAGVHVAAWPCGVIVDMAGSHTEYCLLNTEYTAFRLTY